MLVNMSIQGRDLPTLSEQVFYRKEYVQELLRCISNFTDHHAGQPILQAGSGDIRDVHEWACSLEDSYLAVASSIRYP